MSAGGAAGAVAGATVGGRAVGDYRPELDPRHGHGLDTIAGYVVRATIGPDGALLTPGADLAAFDGPTSYTAALGEARQHRAGRGWAVVCVLYRCGCRST